MNVMTFWLCMLIVLSACANPTTVTPNIGASSPPGSSKPLSELPPAPQSTDEVIEIPIQVLPTPHCRQQPTPKECLPVESEAAAKK